MIDIFNLLAHLLYTGTPYRSIFQRNRVVVKSFESNVVSWPDDRAMINTHTFK